MNWTGNFSVFAESNLRLSLETHPGCLDVSLSDPGGIKDSSLKGSCVPALDLDVRLASSISSLPLYQLCKLVVIWLHAIQCHGRPSYACRKKTDSCQIG